MSDLNHYPNDNPASFEPDPEGDFKEYSGPTQADETPKTESDASSRFGAEILTILEGFGEDIKRLSKSVSEYIDKEAFGKAADSVRDALSDAGEGIKRTTQNMGEKLEEERVQRAIRDLKDYAQRTGKSIQDLFKEEVSTPAEDPGTKVAEAAEDMAESLEHEANDAAENDLNFENTFGG
jgi:gas vesicle protein